MTGGRPWYKCSGITGREEPLCRHRPGGVLTRGAPAPRRAPADLRGDAHRVHGGAAPLQARRLLLPADRRGGHRLGARGDDGPVARAAGAVRAAPRHLHHDCASPARRRAAAHATPTRGHQTADLHRAPERTAIPNRALHARPRDRNPDDDVGRRTAGCAPRTARGAEADVSAGVPAHPSPLRRCARTATAPICHSTSMAALPWPEELFSRTARRGTCGYTARGRRAAVPARWSREASRRTAKRARMDASGALAEAGHLLLRRHEVSYLYVSQTTRRSVPGVSLRCLTHRRRRVTVPIAIGPGPTSAVEGI